MQKKWEKDFNPANPETITSLPKKNKQLKITYSILLTYLIWMCPSGLRGAVQDSKSDEPLNRPLCVNDSPATCPEVSSCKMLCETCFKDQVRCSFFLLMTTQNKMLLPLIGGRPHHNSHPFSEYSPCTRPQFCEWWCMYEYLSRMKYPVFENSI